MNIGVLLRIVGIFRDAIALRGDKYHAHTKLDLLDCMPLSILTRSCLAAIVSPSGSESLRLGDHRYTHTSSAPPQRIAHCAEN